MARILAYTSPALGHLFPFSALLLELSARGHEIHLRTLSTGVEMGRTLGFTTDIIDPESRRSSTMTGRLQIPAVP
jgi:UDP:flavonoid glycosyltransferase YjiC (YdhE family)